MKKRILALLCAGMMVLAFAGCSNSQPSGEGESSPPAQEETGGSTETKRLAYLTPGLDLPFWRYLANGIENEIIDSGMDATVQVYDSKNSSETQLQNAQDAIAQGVDLIIISPTDSSSCPAVLNLAEDAGIPVVIADVGTDSGKYDAFIVTPNAEGSQELGEYVTETAAFLRLEGTLLVLESGAVPLDDIRELIVSCADWGEPV